MPDSNTNSSQSNDNSSSNDERSPGFSNNRLTGKLIAAGLFVLVGTVVVAWSMNYCKECAKDPSHIAHHEDGAEHDALVTKKGPAAKAPLNLKSVATTKKTNLAGVNALTPVKTELPKISPARKNRGQTAGSLKPVAKGGGGSFAPPASKSFNGTAKTKSPATNQFAAAKPKIRNTLKAPVQEINPSGATNQLPPIRSGNQFGGAAANSIRKTASDLTAKTGDTLKKFGERAAEVTDNFKGAVQKRTQSAFVPGTSNTLPSTKSTTTLPPLRSGGGSRAFDQSRELKPFVAGGSDNKSSNGFAGKNSPATTSNTRSVSQPLPPRRNVNAGLPVAQKSTSRPGNPFGGANSATRNPIKSSSSLALPATGVNTAATPGDRRLEGVQSPSVTIEKIAPREVQVNQPADFQLLVKNVGRIAAQGVRVYDQIPTGTELVQSTPQPSRGPNNQIYWDLDTLQPGQEKNIRLQLRPLKPGEIGSVAHVTFAAQASMRTKVTKPVLSVRHVTEPKVLIGDRIVLDIDVKNEGDGAAKDVIIQEDLPEGLEFSEGFRELEYAIGTLAPGQSRRVKLELRAAKIGKYRNVLVAHAGGGLQTQHAVDVEVIAPSLTATGEGPTRRYLKRDATHQFAIRNQGTAQATNVEMVCRLPSGLKFVTANNHGSYDENAHAVYWSLAQLEAGQIANIQLTTTPTEPGNQDLKLEVVSDLNQSAKAVCKLNVDHLTDVFFDIDDVVDPIEIGSETSYKLRIVNQGTKTATNVRLQIDFPQGIQPTGVDGSVTSNIRGQQIAFSPITSMNPGDTIELTVRGKGVSPGDHRVSVNLMADGREVNVSKQESTRVYSDR